MYSRVERGAFIVFSSFCSALRQSLALVIVVRSGKRRSMSPHAN